MYMQVTGKGFASMVPEYRPSRITIKRKRRLQAYRLQLERMSNSKEFICPQDSSSVLHKPKVPQILPRTSAMCVVRTQSHSPYLPGSPHGKEGTHRGWIIRKTPRQALGRDLDGLFRHPSQHCSHQEPVTANSHHQKTHPSDKLS